MTPEIFSEIKSVAPVAEIIAAAVALFTRLLISFSPRHREEKEKESSYFYPINRMKRIPSASTPATEISLPFVSGVPANVEKEETIAKAEKDDKKKKKQWKEPTQGRWRSRGRG